MNFAITYRCRSGEPRRAGVNFQPIPDEESLERIPNELPATPFLVGERGVSMSLAGVQEKLPVLVNEDGRISILIDGTPSTYIIKPDSRRLAGNVENEAFCLALAQACGLKLLMPPSASPANDAICW